MKRILLAVPRLFITLILCAATTAVASVKPHALFCDGAVLQQGMAVPIWGTASDGERITVKFAGQEISTTARDGRWLVRLKPLKAGGPFTMTIQGENTVEIRDVLVGEVWVCSGQSNMAMSVAGTENAQEVAAKSADPMLRLFTVARNSVDEPVRDLTGKWMAAGPASVPPFTAVGYFFGRDLRKALKVPVGLINSSVGGTPAEAWTERAVLEKDADFRVALESHTKAVENWPKGAQKRKEIEAKWKAEVEQAKKEKKQPPRMPATLEDPSTSFRRPSCLYNGMIAPLIPFAIKGALWYQGEGNSGRAFQYRRLLPAMIKNWRDRWAQGDFTFLIVQLAPFMKIEPEPKESAWAELRESQLLTAMHTPKCGLAVITDAGDEADIHPKKKEPAGARLALAARAISYGETIVYSGPLYTSMKVEGNKAVLSFKDVGGGLVAQGGELKGFAICGADKKFVNAKAEIRGAKVVVGSDAVAKPVAVRCGWANYPVVNLFNKEGIPASPFRTDDFPMLTAPKK